MADFKDLSEQDEARLLGDNPEEIDNQIMQEINNKIPPVTTVETIATTTTVSTNVSFTPDMLAPPFPSTSSSQREWLPKLTIREFKESELLTTKGRFKRWEEMVKLELEVANRVRFIEEPLAEKSLSHIPLEQRKSYDASVMQLFRAATSTHVWNCIRTATNFFESTSIPGVSRWTHRGDPILARVN